MIDEGKLFIDMERIQKLAKKRLEALYKQTVNMPDSISKQICMDKLKMMLDDYGSTIHKV